MAYVLSSVSGNLISAASAGFAPTNSAEVSAIASAYQVVSAIGTGWNSDDDEIVSSVNGCILSADEARYAGAAATSNYARYDRRPTVSGGYRTISSLPGSAEVSAIASSYAESAASSKLDTTAQVVTSIDETYPATGGTFISRINGTNILAATADSAGDWIGASSKQDTLSFGYDADDKISAINGSALAGGGATGDYVEKSAKEVAIGTGNTSVSTALAQGYKNSAMYDSFAQGSNNTVSGVSFAQGLYNSASSESFAQGFRNGATGSSFAQGYLNTANGVSFAQGWHNSAKNTAAIFGQYNLRGNGDTATGDSAAFAIGDGTAYNARHDLMLVTKNGEITMYSSTADTVGTGIMSSIRALSANAGGIDSATCSAIASAYAESAVSSYVPYSSLEYNTASAISGINGSALAAGSTYSAGEGIDITDDVISVETPVDIVAGPGIVIDNPDGNTLRVSTDEDYETVLWSGEALTGITLSESLTNFEQIKVVYSEGAGSTRIGYFVTNHFDATHLAGVGSEYYWEDTSEYPMHIHGINLSISNNAVTVVTALAQCFSITNNAFVKWDIGSSFRLLKIVGIHRINGGN